MHSTALDSTLAEEPRQYLLTREGARLRLRPVKLGDGPLLSQFLSRVSAEDLRFRFLDSRKLPNPKEIAALLEVDHRRSEHVLAFDTASGELVATLLVVADRRMETAEVAIAVAADWKGRGLGWTLLRHASDLAFIRGVKKLRSIESRANHDALEVEQALGFRARPVEGDPTLMLVEADLG